MSPTLAFTPNRKATMREFAVNSVTHLNSKLTGHGYACPHFPKSRSREYPSCLGFFHENDKEKIVYIELAKLCENCCSEVVQKDYNVWICENSQFPRNVSGRFNGTVPKGHSIWNVPDSSKGLYREFIQAGTPLRKGDSMGPPEKELTARGRFNLPTAIQMPQDTAAEGVWAWLKKSGKPFYIEQLHLVKRWTPWTEKMAMEDFGIAIKHGNSYQPSFSTKSKPSSKPAKKDFLSGITANSQSLPASPGLVEKRPKATPKGINNSSMKASTGDPPKKSGKKSSPNTDEAAMKPHVSATKPPKAEARSSPRSRVKEFGTIEASTGSAFATMKLDPIAGHNHERRPTREALRNVKPGAKQDGGTMPGRLGEPLDDVSLADIGIRAQVAGFPEPRTRNGGTGSRSGKEAPSIASSLKSQRPLPPPKPQSRRLDLQLAAVGRSSAKVGVFVERYGIIPSIPLGSPDNFARSHNDARSEPLAIIQSPPIFQHLLSTYDAHQKRSQNYQYQQGSPQFPGYGEDPVQEYGYDNGSNLSDQNTAAKEGKTRTENPSSERVPTATSNQKQKKGSSQNLDPPTSTSQSTSKRSNKTTGTAWPARRDNAPHTRSTASDHRRKTQHTNPPHEKPKPLNEKKAAGHSGGKENARGSKTRTSDKTHAKKPHNSTSKHTPKTAHEKQGAGHTSQRGDSHGAKSPKNPHESPNDKSEGETLHNLLLVRLNHHVFGTRTK